MTREHHALEKDSTEIHRASSLQNVTKKDSTFLPTTRRITQFANGVAPKKGDKVVYIDGSFDLFHPGHVAALKAAKELGDFLYVGMHNDQVVNEQHGSNYPICTLHERALCVLACKYVDEVVFGAPWEVTKELVTLLNVSIVVEVPDIKFASHEAMDEAKRFELSKACYAVPREMQMYVNLEEEEGFTCENNTQADVVNRIVENRLNFMKKFEKKSAAEENYKEQREHVA